MGDSGKLPDPQAGTYSFDRHRAHLDALLDALGVDRDVTLVLHDWGSALGFDWAYRHASAVKAIAYMEAIVRPMSWADWPEAVRPVFQALRSDAGEAMVLEHNAFIEEVLPHAILRELTEAEMDEYRRPFRTPADRRPTLEFPRLLPIDGSPAEICDIVARYGEWLAASPVPKLLVRAEPGVLLRGENLAYCRTWPNQTEVTVAGLHFVQEDSPHEIGAALAEWLGGLG
jgi:haloalkane dehalogenase